MTDRAEQGQGGEGGDPVRVDVAVVGAGVAGLAVARSLIEADRTVVVLEARDRVGGRLLSIVPGSAPGSPAASDDPRLDLGATWFWPGEQRVAALVAEFGIETHQQHLAGDAMYHDPSGPQRIDGNPIDVPSFRFVAGAQRLPERLAEALPSGTVQTRTVVQRVVDVGADVGRLRLDLTEASGAIATVEAGHVVLALPPALAVARIGFEPALPERLAGLAAVTPVWMGAVAKVVAVYDRAFWRDRGLAGSAISHLGPMREIHDMSGPDGAPAALFGFVPRTGGGPVTTEEQRDGPSEDAVREQLVTLFGAEAADPVELVIADWRQEPHTSPDGVERLTAYQAFGHEGYHTPAMNGRLHWASTETGRVAPGHIEGALEAAERVVTTIVGTPPTN